jgi:mycofactocin system glycosyltransferase
MKDGIPKGRYILSTGVEIIPASSGGVLLQWNPMRAIQLNGMGYRMLSEAVTGLELEPSKSLYVHVTEETLRFVDLLFQAEVLAWIPPPAAFEPQVSIIVPVYNRADEIGACIESLLNLDYPPSKREIIVVDDGSRDHTAAVVRQYDVRLLVMPHNSGQSAARNRGVQSATGEIVAFIDSDCTAHPQWLRNLLPYFNDSRIALVGGRVDGLNRQTWLDRYETTHSALNMGSKIRLGAGPHSDFYVPTCNMLVRRQAFESVGGLDERLRVGEDVDLCWRLKANRYRGLYVPVGPVRHRHRNRFWSNFKRRYDYGTSEAMLYARHPSVTKRFPWQTAGLALIALSVLGLLTRSWLVLPIAALVLLLEGVVKQHHLKQKFGIRISLWAVIRAAAKSHGILAHYLSYYWIRYYLAASILLTALVPSIWPLTGVLALFPALVEYFRKRSLLSFPVFGFFFWMEQIFYQIGVMCGCQRTGNWRLYGIRFIRSGSQPIGRFSFLNRLRMRLRSETRLSSEKG